MTTATPRTTPRKNEFIFYRRISQMPKSVQYVYRAQNLPKLNMHAVQFQKKKRKLSLRRLRCLKYAAELGYFTLLFCSGRLRNVQRFITHVHSHCSAH